jgi:2-haloacid dehalogenase
MKPDTVVFDLGNVLIGWDPRNLYRKLFLDEAAMETFLAEICTPDWNVQQDAGRPIREAEADLVARFPEHADLIRAYYGRFMEMLSGPIAGTVTLLEALHAKDTPLFALTNWSAETFAIARPNFPFLELFRHIVVSGELGIAKPDPAIFRHLLQVAGKPAQACFFIDDNAANVASARSLGFAAHHFSAPAALHRDLEKLGLL